MLPMNRPISMKHVMSLQRSVSTYGVLRDVICVSTDIVDTARKTWIVDGQHLYHALLRLNMPIPVRMVKVKSIQELVDLVARLNNTSKQWNMHDYVHCWSSLVGYADYSRLLKYRDHHKLSYTVLAMACCPSHPSGAIERIKKGSFKIEDRELTNTILGNLESIFKLFPKGYRSEVSHFVQAYIGFYISSKRYVHHKMLDAIRINKTRLTASLSTVGECRECLNMIYNAGTSVDNTHVLTAVRAGSLKDKPKADKVSKSVAR